MGRFGWKAETATLEEFVAKAFRNELGITSPLAPTDLLSSETGCGRVSATLDDDGHVVRSVTSYIASLAPPSASADSQGEDGFVLFAQTGCGECHIPALPGRNAPVWAFSDLLIHDMGPMLDDGVVEGDARGRDWRTTPLWGLGNRSRFLHDGRATTIREAIVAHDGEAAAAVKSFRTLTTPQQDVILAFLSNLH